MMNEQENPNEKSNRVPLPNEVSALRSLVDAESAVLEAIKASLAKAVDTTIAAQKRVRDAQLEFEAAVSSLAAAQASVRTLEGLMQPVIVSIEEKKAVLHPIRRLPPELLFDIFRCCVEEDEAIRCVDSDLDGGWGPCDKPLVLGAVCSLWRHIVHTRSSLWQYFNVSLSKFMQRFVNNQDHNPFMQRLNAWAHFSADRKMNIAIRDIGDGVDSDGLRAAVMIRCVLSALGDRTGKLQLLFAGGNAIGQILAPSLSGRLPSLQHLTVHVSESVHAGTAYIPGGAFRASTSLEVIQLRNIWWDTTLSLESLKVFDVYNPDWRISPQQFLGIIAGCPNLREMPIEFEYRALVNHNQLSPVTFQYLESLNTTCEWITLAGPILCQYMTAPNLSNLQLYGRCDVHVLARFIEIVAPNLEHLHLGISPTEGYQSDLDLIVIFRSAPRLADFAVDSVVITSEFLDALSVSEGPNIIAPLLTTIVFKDVTFSDPNALLRMVDARTKRGLNEKSCPRRLMILEIQGGKEMGINTWHEQQINEMMLHDDEEAGSIEAAVNDLGQMTLSYGPGPEEDPDLE